MRESPCNKYMLVHDSPESDANSKFSILTGMQKPTKAVITQHGGNISVVLHLHPGSGFHVSVHGSSALLRPITPWDLVNKACDSGEVGTSLIHCC